MLDLHEIHSSPNIASERSEARRGKARCKELSNNLKDSNTLQRINLCSKSSELNHQEVHLLQKSWFFPLAFLLVSGSMPASLQAGSAAFDNSGRIPCGADGRITAAGWEALKLRSPTELKPGAMATIPAVCPAERYFPTGVILTPGATYQIDAQGRWQDLWFRVGPNGWAGLLLEAGNRLPWQRFFLLAGAIGRSEAQLFPIGQSRRWTAPGKLLEGENRQLYLFANDWNGMLHNNRSVPDDKGGPLRVSITRIPETSF